MQNISRFRLYKMVPNELLNVNFMKDYKQSESGHFFKCEGCGKVIDRRDLGQVFSHGWINKKTGKIECSYQTSIRKGDNVAWTKTKTGLT